MKTVMEMPLSYISNSSFSLFQKDPIEWYKQYFVARFMEENRFMTLGKIFQTAWCDKKFDFEKALREKGFTSDKARAMRFALNHPQTIKLPKAKTEKTVKVKGMGLVYPILAQFDGVDPDGDIIVENKWGIVWTQKRVNEGVYFDSEGRRQRDTQITWYMLVYKIKYGRLPKHFVLQSFNGKNGMPNKLEAKRSQKDLDQLVFDINNMVAMVRAGEFKKKVYA